MSTTPDPTQSSTPTFLLHLSSAHLSFRLPELHSIAKLYNFSLSVVPSPNLSSDAPLDSDPEPKVNSESTVPQSKKRDSRGNAGGNPDRKGNEGGGILLVKLSGETMDEMIQNGRKLAERCICVKSVHILIASGTTYPTLISAMKSLPLPPPWEPDRQSTYYIDIKSIGHHISGTRKASTFSSLSFMDFRGQVRMKNAQVTYTLFEEYQNLSHVEGEKDGGKQRELDRDGMFEAVYMGKLVGEGKARKLIDKFDVKRRAFYGNTSMESEMSLLMANQALASPEKLIYDPFAGTGSMLYTSAWFGAMVLGSDIDGRQMRGKAKSKPGPDGEVQPVIPGIYRAAEQYNIRNQILDCLTFDVTRCPWRDVDAGEVGTGSGSRGGWIDAIVTDPPYGVRAGAKRQGRREGKRRELVEPVMLGKDGIIAVSGAEGWAHEQPDYIPPFTPYELSHLIYDLLVLSRWLLVKGGRLVFFLPTMTPVGEWATSNPNGDTSSTDATSGEPAEIPVEIPQVEGMKEIVYGSGSAQDFGRWSRRLITIEKVGEGPYGRPDFVPEDKIQGKVPGHHMFRERFFDKTLDELKIDGGS